jgi:peptidoglycan/xylan/chitin deacetylase (PgdA/CDA1 family)
MSRTPAWLQLLTAAPLRQLMQPLVGRRASIFVLHRLDNPQAGVRGHSEHYLREAVAALKHSGAQFVSLRDIVESRDGDQRHSPHRVAFTMDDGFADQIQICSSVFIPAQCPVTIFPITGFVDGQLWPWDDQLAWLIHQTPLTLATLTLHGQTRTVSLNSPAQRLDALRQLRSWCKQAAGADVYDTLQAFTATLQVPLPVTPPAAYQPMTWAQARELQTQGVDFGIHTRSHRIIAQLSAEEVQDELQSCWARLQAELTNPLPVVSWPTGYASDYGPRDEQIARELGFTGACSSVGDYARLDLPADSHGYTLARFALSGSLSRVVQQGTWVERGKQFVRGT